jgi:hypothetical protein
MIEREQSAVVRRVVGECLATVGFEIAAPLTCDQLLNSILKDEVRDVAKRGISKEQESKAIVIV